MIFRPSRRYQPWLSTKHGNPPIGLSDIAQAAAAVTLAFSGTYALSDTANASDSLTLGGAQAYVDTAQASDALTLYGAGPIAFSDSAQARDTLALSVRYAFSDTANASDALDLDYPANFALTDTANAADSLTLGGIIPLALADIAEASDALTLSDAIAAAATDHAFVINTETAAASEYTNFAFDSFANLDGTVYAIDANGLYTLGGGDDAGTAIAARFATGLSDLGSDKHKRMDSIRYGLSTDGELVAKVRAVENGALNEYWYQPSVGAATAPRERITEIGKGLRSVYWAVEIANKAGADFTLERLDLYPIPLERRR